MLRWGLSCLHVHGVPWVSALCPLCSEKGEGTAEHRLGVQEGCQTCGVPRWGGRDGKALCGVREAARTGQSFRKRYQPS